jgi:hypothetical protein
MRHNKWIKFAIFAADRLEPQLLLREVGAHTPDPHLFVFLSEMPIKNAS